MSGLAGMNDTVRGWGVTGETWSFMSALKQLGGEDWFALGDRDLATHVERTRRIRQGETLSAITADFARRFGIGASIVPMSDDPVRTVVETPHAKLDFQDYFVRQHAEPQITGLSFSGAGTARVSPAAATALADPALDLVILCPSNPWLSVLPILETGDMRARLSSIACPVSRLRRSSRGARSKAQPRS